LSHYKSTKTRREGDLLPIKTKNYYFFKFDKVWIRIRDPDAGTGSGIRIRIEILSWIPIRIKRMRIQNTASNTVLVTSRTHPAYPAHIQLR
jgi:hypothetical protein